jgi:hypothetical protein
MFVFTGENSTVTLVERLLHLLAYGWSEVAVIRLGLAAFLKEETI